LFSKFITSNGITFRKIKLKNYANEYDRFSITTIANPIFTKYHNLFYKSIPTVLEAINTTCQPLSLARLERGRDGNINVKKFKTQYVKIIPINIETLIIEVSLAFLVSGDGNYNKIKKVIRLCTNSYSKNEVELLSHALFNKFGIESRLEHTRNNQYILIIKTSQVTKFQDIVKEHLHPSMFYRIGLDNSSNI
jgi:hypothetical protein